MARGCCEVMLPRRNECRAQHTASATVLGWRSVPGRVQPCAGTRATVGGGTFYTPPTRRFPAGTTELGRCVTYSEHAPSQTSIESHPPGWCGLWAGLSSHKCVRAASFFSRARPCCAPFFVRAARAPYIQTHQQVYAARSRTLEAGSWEPSPRNPVMVADALDRVIHNPRIPASQQGWIVSALIFFHCR